MRIRGLFISLALAGVLLPALLWAARPTTTASSDASRTRPLTPRAIPVKPAHTTIAPDAGTEQVIVKFVAGTRLRLAGDRLVSLSGIDLDRAAAVLADKSAAAMRPLFSLSPERIERQTYRLEQRVGRRLADLNNYITIDVASPAEAEALINRLNRLPEVEIAYPAPRPEPTGDIDPPTPDFTASQTYLQAAPDGIDAVYAATQTGGDGDGVRIVDIEGAWQLDHEDLDLPPETILGGNIVDQLDWRNHGTAVIGALVGRDNGYGITGIVPAADIALVSYDGLGVAEAILLAADSLRAGDIIMIEVGAPGPRYNFQVRFDQLGYVCMEYWQAEFDAMQIAWAKGIIVCEAAANGGENLMSSLYENRFDTTYRNSHAIIIGAGAPPSGNYGTDRSRLSYSNYGARVNVQGYGQEVYTTGYGTSFDGGGDELQFYTDDFAGTSAATPIVAGAVVALQGLYKNRFGGAVMHADAVRDLLVATGSPQQGSQIYHIGPRPDIRAADSVLPAPSDLAPVPAYIDTTVAVGTQMTIYIDLINASPTETIEYSAIVADSLAKAPASAWLSVVNPAGQIAPGSQTTLEVILDATIIDDRSQIYKGLIELWYAPTGSPLDSLTVIPVFLDIPCADTTYAALADGDTGGPVFAWRDITQSGWLVPTYSWYNPFVEEDEIDDGTAGAYVLGFEFPFYDTTYTEVYIGANGALSFTDENLNDNGFFSDITIPAPPFTTLVSPFWNDLNMSPTYGGHGSVYFYRSSQNDSFIVLYHQVGNFDAPDDTLTTFEAILHKNGNITFQYLSVGQSGLETSAVIGIAENDCASVPYIAAGDPIEHLVGDSTAILFDYVYVIWEMSGDANSDRAVNVGDAVYLINWIFKGGTAPKNMLEADANCDGEANVGDAVYLINYTFKGGPEPCLYIL